MFLPCMNEKPLFVCKDVVEEANCLDYHQMAIWRFPSFIEVDHVSTRQKANVDDEKFATIQETDWNKSPLETAHLQKSLDEESERNENHKEENRYLF